MKVRVSKKGIDFLKAIEEYRSYPYDDQTGEEIEVWVPGATIGYGHLISESEWPQYSGRSINQLEADYIFSEDLVPFESAVMGAISNSFQLLEHQFDALVMLAFNIGKGGFSNSSVVKLINDPSANTSYDDLESAWMAWNKSQGKVMRGLINRRGAEWQIYASGTYEMW